jgi:hypothetical protein
LQFVPTPAQWRYLRAYLDPDSSGAIKHCAARANVNWRTVYDWLADDRFREWFTDETRRVFSHRLPAMWAKCMDLACSGSPDHIRLIALRTGELLNAGSPDQRSPAHTAVFINVPRPQQLDTAQPAALPEASLPTAIDTELVTPETQLR